ncbi:MAG TPA: AAA family ATPase [Candidatus Saccharimonadaceae bacterium]|nr:AAA family ATPase [Candidatus Saccharimonadaceae bacterium]
MKLLRIKVDGFGPLKCEFDFKPDKMTVLVDDNERGKSSLLAAITAALYGLDDDKRTYRLITPIERWRPWQGGAYRVELDYELGGHRHSIHRDFEKNTVEVWNERGQQITEEFRAGKDEYLIGKKLLGLDLAEFEKCALVLQGELDQVVPGDEKTRRGSTLHARLENAADTKVGDTNATEALQVLDGALRRYDCPELDSTVNVENAIKALEAKLGMLETDLKTLEHEQTQLAGPVDELARISEDEKVARDALTRLDAERRGSMASELRRQVKSHAEQKLALDALKKEAEGLRGVAHLSTHAEAELRETIARYEEAQRNLETLEGRRRDEQARERKALETESESLTAYANCASGDADRFVAMAAEIRRIAEEDGRLRSEVFNLRDSLAGTGWEPERINFLKGRFAGLPEEKQKLMRGQSEVALAFQTEVAGLEQQRTESTETLRDIDTLRNARRMPGWFLVALGLGGAAAGAVLIAVNGQMGLWTSLIAGGALSMIAGVIMLVTGGNARQVEREAALHELSDAQRRLNQLRSKRAETEVGLAEMSREMGYRDPIDLVREWTEYWRLSEENGPVLRAEAQLLALESQKKSVLEETKTLLQKVGGGIPDPSYLERVAGGIRHLSVVKQRMTEMERSWSWIDEEKRVAEAAATGLKQRAIGMLQAAGLAYDPQRPWADHVADIAERSKDRSRYTLLHDQLIPQAEKQMRPAEEIAQLESQLKTLEAEGGAGDESASGRAPLDIEHEAQRNREALDQIQRRRSDLRLQVDETLRRHSVEHPEKLAEKERLDHALGRAKRFKTAVEMARATIEQVALETHRRWAEHLNQRVSQLLSAVGTQMQELRFGEDLDFSVRFANGQRSARGKAVLQISSGARDQLHLAVRLAISEYLSRGQEPLPFLIDDAFATSDDDRTRAAMKLLLEHFSKRHQILLVTCHRKRYEALAALDPELYADRVQWLDAKRVAASS